MRRALAAVVIAAGGVAAAGSASPAAQAPSGASGEPACEWERDGVYGREFAFEADPDCAYLDLQVRCKDGQILVRIEPPDVFDTPPYPYTTGPVACAAIRRITVSGTSGEDILDLSQVKAKNGFDMRSSTVLGLGGSDEIWGTGFNDNILGGAGHASGSSGDYILGYGGDDRITGGPGPDGMSGGRHDDVLRGGVKRDILAGRTGDDLLNGGPDYDQLFPGPGQDTIEPSPGGDDVFARR